MPAIGFDMIMDRQPDPKSGRVMLTMTGKFLLFKITALRGISRRIGIRRSRARGRLSG
jgi:hypothetical protein